MCNQRSRKVRQLVHYVVMRAVIGTQLFLQLFLKLAVLVAHPVSSLSKRLAQMLLQGRHNANVFHRHVHALHPLIAFTVADLVRQVTRTQARMAKAFNKQIWAAGPARQKPEQLVARTVQCWRMHGADTGKGRLEIHQIVKAVNQRTYAGFTIEQVVQRALLFLRLIVCGRHSLQ